MICTLEPPSRVWPTPANQYKSVRMKPHPLPLLCFALCLCLIPTASAKIEEWRDAQGNTFKAEAVQALGPTAIFRTEQRWARVIPFLALPPEECVRFYEQTQNHPQPAQHWENAKDDFGRDLYRYTMQLRIDRLDPSWLKGRPEPEFTIVIYGSANESKSWDSIDLLLPLYQQLKDAHGDRIEAVFYGLNHKSGDQLLMAERKNMPWLIADFGQQSQMDIIRRFAPSSRAGVLVFSHTGLPFFAADISNVERITTPLIELAALLDIARPENPKAGTAALTTCEPSNPPSTPTAAATPSSSAIRSNPPAFANVTSIVSKPRSPWTPTEKSPLPT